MRVISRQELTADGWKPVAMPGLRHNIAGIAIIIVVASVFWGTVAILAVGLP